MSHDTETLVAVAAWLDDEYIRVQRAELQPPRSPRASARQHTDTLNGRLQVLAELAALARSWAGRGVVPVHPLHSCGERCSNGSPCVLPGRHDGPHQTEHGCLAWEPAR